MKTKGEIKTNKEEEETSNILLRIVLQLSLIRTTEIDNVEKKKQLRAETEIKTKNEEEITTTITMMRNFREDALNHHEAIIIRTEIKKREDEMVRINEKEAKIIQSEKINFCNIFLNRGNSQIAALTANHIKFGTATLHSFVIIRKATLKNLNVHGSCYATLAINFAKDELKKWWDK